MVCSSIGKTKRSKPFKMYTKRQRLVVQKSRLNHSELRIALVQISVRVHRVAGSPGARSDQGASHVHLDVGADDLHLANRAAVTLLPEVVHAVKLSLPLLRYDP